MPWLSGVKRLRPGRRGAVAVIAALGLLPLSLMVGLAIDYSFYVSARAQLNLAADSAAMHAVRVASSASSGSSTAAQIAAGKTAAQQWFAAQLGTLSIGSVNTAGVSAVVTYAASPSTYTATVSYAGTVPTHFSALFGLGSWPISGTATSVVSNLYVEILLLLDNSGSMLLGSSASDILALEQATICPTKGRNSTINMWQYPWNYAAHSPSYGFGTAQAVPPVSQSGSCSPLYDGTSYVCLYPMTSPYISPTTGRCTNGGGGPAPDTGTGTNFPQAPCGFACHSSASNDDFLAIARSLGVTLRLDVVQSAAANTIAKMASEEQSQNQFSVGVYQFNTALQQVFPTSGESSNDLATAQTTVENIKNTPVLTSDLPNTNFPAAANALAAQVSNSGNGLAPTSPQKNLFIVTDGMEDITTNGQASGQVLSPMTSSTNETICQQFKTKGFAVYVLYIPYLPIPIASYLTKGKPVAEPTTTSTNIQALQACATGSQYFYSASDATSINTAMTQMLQSAINSSARISN